VTEVLLTAVFLLLPKSCDHTPSCLPGIQTIVLVVLCLTENLSRQNASIMELYSPQADFFPDLLGIWAAEFKSISTCSGRHIPMEMRGLFGELLLCLDLQYKIRLEI